MPILIELKLLNITLIHILCLNGQLSVKNAASEIPTERLSGGPAVKPRPRTLETRLAAAYAYTLRQILSGSVDVARR